MQERSSWWWLTALGTPGAAGGSAACLWAKRVTGEGAEPEPVGRGGSPGKPASSRESSGESPGAKSLARWFGKVRAEVEWESPPPPDTVSEVRINGDFKGEESGGLRAAALQEAQGQRRGRGSGRGRPRLSVREVEIPVYLPAGAVAVCLGLRALLPVQGVCPGPH